MLALMQIRKCTCSDRMTLLQISLKTHRDIYAGMYMQTYTHVHTLTHTTTTTQLNLQKLT